MHIGKYLNLVYRTEKDLAAAFREVGEAHKQEWEICHTCQLLASWCDKLGAAIEPVLSRYESEPDKEPDRLTKALLRKPRKGGMALLRDLHDLYLVATEVVICCTVLKQGADGLRDKELTALCEEIERQTKRQLSSLMTAIKAAAPQTLIVAE